MSRCYAVGLADYPLSVPETGVDDPFTRITRPQLNFAPPYAEFAASPEGFRFWWLQLQYVFDLPNPHRFPRLMIDDPDLLRKIRRYQQVCKQLSVSTLLSFDGSTKLSWKQGDDEPIVTTVAPTVEAIRGVSATFRQIASDNELASYTAVRKAIGIAIENQADEHRDQRREWQKKWNRARGQLNMFSLRFLVERKMHSEMGHSAPDQWASDADVKPLSLIRKFQYGDLLHWGDTRDDLEDLQRNDAASHALSFHKFLTSIIQLSHFYLGYAQLTARVAPRRDASDLG